MPADFRAFTKRSNRTVRVLDSEAKVGIAFDPSRSPDPPLHDCNAIWDTGATGSVISQQVVTECGLKPIGMARVGTAAGVITSEVYLVSIYLPNKVAFPKVRVTLNDIRGADILIGMDIIGSGDFAVTNHDGKTTFSYCVPSIAQIDFVEKANQLNKTLVGNRVQRRKAAQKKSRIKSKSKKKKKRH